MENLSQTEAIRKHLESGKSITPLDALSNFSCMRLSARIRNLRDTGLAISSRMIERNGKRFAEYSIAKLAVIALFTIATSCTTLKPGCHYQRHRVRVAQLEKQYEHSLSANDDWTREFRNQHQSPRGLNKFPFINVFFP